MKEDNRHDKCKCGKFIIWTTEDDIVICLHCGTAYKVDCDSVLEYWLEEKIERQQPFRTDMR